MSNPFDLYEMWHKKVAKKLVEDETNFEASMAPVGKAAHIHYRSDKWERDGDVYPYIHEFESHPTVYFPSSQVEKPRHLKATTSLLKVKSLRAEMTLPDLARVTKLIFTSPEGDMCEVKFRGAVMSCTGDRKTLIIIDSRGDILIRGGQMTVEKEGITR